MYNAPILLFLGGYSIGSIPMGFIIARLKGIHDIRVHGSGNTGATNVARMLGVSYFFLVFALDFLKAYGLIVLAQWYGASEWHQCILSGGLLVGNAFPLFLQFKGGKLISTSCGIISALNILLMAPLGITWLIVFLLTRTVGVASIVGLFTLPLYALLFTHSLYIHTLAVIIAVMGLWLHRTNIHQLLTQIAVIKR